jgi:hypothetical protein
MKRAIESHDVTMWFRDQLADVIALEDRRAER